MPEEDVHLELDVSGDGDMEAKIACILCHRTQVAPDWPYHRVPRHVTARILGREFYVRAHPAVADGENRHRRLLRGTGLSSPDKRTAEHTMACSAVFAYSTVLAYSE